MVEIGSIFALVLSRFGVVGWKSINLALGLATDCLVEVLIVLGGGEDVEIGLFLVWVLARFGVVGWMFINLALGLAINSVGTLGGGGNVKFGFILNLQEDVVLAILDLAFGFLVSGGKVEVQ